MKILLNILSGGLLLSIFLWSVADNNGNEKMSTICADIGGGILIIFVVFFIGAIIYRLIIKQIRKNNVKKYREYLESEEWEILKEQRISKQPICECCGIKKSIILHHLSYKNVGSEEHTDLVCVCSSCHDKCHYDDWGNKIELNEINLRERFEKIKSN